MFSNMYISILPVILYYYSYMCIGYYTTDTTGVLFTQYPQFTCTLTTPLYDHISTFHKQWEPLQNKISSCPMHTLILYIIYFHSFFPSFLFIHITFHIIFPNPISFLLFLSCPLYSVKTYFLHCYYYSSIMQL